VIQLSQLSKSFGERVLLDSVTWQIDDRERVGLSGPNGAGKTTLLKMLAGIDEPDDGQIVKPAGLTIGYLPQDVSSTADERCARKRASRSSRCST
jgi:ATPase subunit of ABC transporter with duplicated ATPase domains